MANPHFGKTLEELGELARMECLPARTEQRKIAMALLLKAETQEVFLDQIYELVRFIDTDSPCYELLRSIQAAAYQGARIWEKSSKTSSEPTVSSETSR